MVLILPHSQSLKDKRSVLSSVTHRVHNKFNVSIAEIEANDRWQRAVLGISCVSNSSSHVREMLMRVARFIEAGEGDYEVSEDATEVLPVF